MNMDNISSWLLIAYLLVSAANLFFCYLELEKLRKITKPLCMIPLIVITMAFDLGNYWLWLSLIFAWIGDILFIFKHNKAFVIVGILFFFAAHIFYLLEFFVSFKTNTPSIVSSYAAFLRFYPLFIMPAIPVSYFLSKKDWKLTIVGSIYQSALIGVIASSIFGLVNTGLTFYGFILIGSVFYYISDLLNAFTLYIKKISRRDFYIMFFYLLAQPLILLGFSLTIHVTFF